MNPDGATMKKMLDLATKRFNQMLGALQIKADQVNHYVRSQISDLPTERSRSLIFVTIDFYSLNRSPRSVRPIRLTLAAADRDHFVSSRHQPGNKIGSNVSTSTNDNDAHQRLWHEEKKTEARHELPRILALGDEIFKNNQRPFAKPFRRWSRDRSVNHGPDERSRVR
jgi:hypothetical protein